MADITQRVPENTSGRVYVDATSIDCDLCPETAPANFARNDTGGHSFVVRQPEGPAQEAVCAAAMEECPVEAIGDDGLKAG
jgi:ferredoxin